MALHGGPIQSMTTSLAPLCYPTPMTLVLATGAPGGAGRYPERLPYRLIAFKLRASQGRTGTWRRSIMAG